MKLRPIRLAAATLAATASLAACQRSDADASTAKGVPGSPGLTPDPQPVELVGCEDKLKSADFLDSRLFTAIEIETDALNARSARAAVQQAAAVAGCEEEEVGHLFEEGGQAACRTLISGKPDSLLCYVESDYGTFVVSNHPVQGVNVLFNRFD
jgi:hypothetical protein